MFKWMQSGTLSTGLAMFSMLFGAGNVVFPLAIGQYAQDANVWAILGLLISAVLVPFLGVTTMTLYKGDYMAFFGRIGPSVGFIVAVLIMGLIGPLGATPRCITLAYSTLQLFFPDLSFFLYSGIAFVLILGLTYSQQRLLEILGYVLTPFLLVSLAIVIIKGLLSGPPAPVSNHSALFVFMAGLMEGFYTMDLLGAFFFSTVVLVCLEQELQPHELSDKRRLISMTLKASCIGAVLLAVIYIGFSIVAALYSDSLAAVPKDVLLGSIAMNVLGAGGGVVALTAVVLACLTTAIALVAVFAQFLQTHVFRERLGYHPCLWLTLIATFCVSTLRFNGIAKILEPILMITYPALIILTLCNLAYQLWGFKPVKTPFWVTLGASFIYWATSVSL